MEQISFAAQETIDSIRQIPSHLCGPLPIWSPMNSGHAHPSGRQLNHEED